MTDTEKLNTILTLLCDKTVGKLVKAKQINGEQEEYGALVAIGYCFRKANEIYYAK